MHHYSKKVLIIENTGDCDIEPVKLHTLANVSYVEWYKVCGNAEQLSEGSIQAQFPALIDFAC